MPNSYQDQVRDLHFGGFMRGRVVVNKDEKKEGRLGLFIPSLITETPNHLELPAPKSGTIPPSLFANGEELSLPTQVKCDNYIWARPTAWFVENGTASKNASGSYRVPEVGTMVTVYFENDDPNNPRWLPFSPTVDGDVIAGTNLGKGLNLDKTLANWQDDLKRTKIHVVAEYNNGNIIAVDNNPDVNAFVIRWANGHTFSVSHAEESGFVMQTEKGHIIHLDENSKEIRIATHTGKSRVVLSDSGNITIDNTGNTTVTTKGNVTVKADGNASVNAKGNASVEAKGSGIFSADGSVSIKSKSAISIAAPSVSIKKG